MEKISVQLETLNSIDEISSSTQDFVHCSVN